MKNLIREIWIGFLTEPQSIPTNKEIDLLQFVRNYINNIEGCFATEGNLSVCFHLESRPQITILELKILEEKDNHTKFQVIDSAEILSSNDADLRKDIGQMVGHIMNSITEYQIQNDELEFQTKGRNIEIPLSQTNVRLSKEETTTITEILYRLAKDRRIKYSNLKNKSFEILLRGYIEDDESSEDTEENTDPPDFEWI